MSTAARAQALIDAGYYVAPAHGYALLTPDVDPRRTPYTAAEAARADLNIYHGVQRDGRYLAKIDLDSHHEGQDADTARAALEAALPHVARRICWQRSTSGRGWWGWVRTTKQLPHGQIVDADGQHLGELLSSDDSRSLDPGDIAPDTLRLTEREHLLSFWAVRTAESSGDRWSARAAEGKRYTVGYMRHQVNRPMLRSFLRQQCGTVGAHLDALFNERGHFDRSAAAGNLMQTLLFNIHKIAPNANYAEKCALAYAYWLAADSYGKAADKDYNQQKDGCALLAAILHEDRKLSGGNWRAPFWAKAHPTPTPQPEIEATPAPTPRAAHRPAGDRDKQIGKLKRILERWQFESAERIYYYVDDLAELLHVKRRAAQNYLEALADDNQIERGQDRGRGGRAWLILLPAFWGAQNSENAPENAEKSPAVWGAQPMPIERIAAPESADRAPQCKGDHQNLCAPISEPGGAAYSPTWCYVPGENWHSPSDPRIRTDKPAPTPRPVAPAQRLPRTRRRVKGQASYLDRRGEQLGKRYQTQPGGQAPEPTRHKPQASTLVPRRRQASPGAPLGAHGSGDLLSAPAGAPPTAAQPSLASNIDLGYIRRLLTLGDQTGIERHCIMRGADWQAVVQLAQQVQP